MSPGDTIYSCHNVTPIHIPTKQSTALGTEENFFHNTTSLVTCSVSANSFVQNCYITDSTFEIQPQNKARILRYSAPIVQFFFTLQSIKYYHISLITFNALQLFILFSPSATTCPYRLRGPPSPYWLRPKCNRPLSLGRV
jgi:hypothetical protein